MINHRWLPVYDVTLNNLRIFDCLTLFYKSFLNKNDRLLYLNVCFSIYKQRGITDESKNKIKEIWKYLQNKQFTMGGKKMKEDCFKIIFLQEKVIIYNAFFYWCTSFAQKIYLSFSA